MAPISVPALCSPAEAEEFNRVGHGEGQGLLAVVEGRFVGDL